MLDLWLGIKKLKQWKACKKEIRKELIPLVWHCCVSEDEKKEIKTFLVDKKTYCKWVMYDANAVWKRSNKTQ